MSHQTATEEIEQAVLNPTEEKPRPEKYSQIEQVVQDSDLLVLSDGDADGLASYGLIKSVFGVMDVGLIPVGPHGSVVNKESAIRVVNRSIREGMTVYLCDVSLDEGFRQKDALRSIGETGRLHVFDHHEWADNIYSIVTDVSETVVVEQESEWKYNGKTIDSKSTVKLLYDHFVTENGHSFTPSIEDRVKAVSLADTWETVQTETGEEFLHPQSSMFMYSADQILEDIPLPERTPSNMWGFKEWTSEFLSETSDLDVIESNAEKYYSRRTAEAGYICSSDELFRQYALENLSVGIAYGQTDPNILARQMFEYGCHLVCLIRPNTGISFRSQQGSFDNCHTLAGLVGGGGGHEHASGTTVKYLRSFTDESFRENYGQLLDTELMRLVSEVA